MVTPVDERAALEAHHARPACRTATSFWCTSYWHIFPGVLSCRSADRCNRAIHGKKVNSETHPSAKLDSMENSRGYRLRYVWVQQEANIGFTGEYKAQAALTDSEYAPRSVTNAVRSN